VPQIKVSPICKQLAVRISLGFAFLWIAVPAFAEKTVVKDQSEFFTVTTPAMTPSEAAAETTIQHTVYFNDLEGNTSDWGVIDYRAGQPNAWHVTSGTHSCVGNAWWCGQSGFVNGDGYDNNWVQTLKTNIPIDLTGSSNNKLTFKYRLQSEWGYDWGWVLIHDANTFSAWDTLGSYSGNFGSSCNSPSINIPDSWTTRPQPIQLQFLFASDLNVSTADSAGTFTGWTLDDVKITAQGNVVKFFDDMESGTSKWVASSPDPGANWHIESGPQTTPPAGCGFLNSSVFVPFPGSVYGTVPDFTDAMLTTPVIDLSNAHFNSSGTTLNLQFDQWIDLPSEDAVYWSLWISGSNNLTTWTPWRNAFGTLVFSGGTPQCGTLVKQFNPYLTTNTGIQPGTRYIRLGIRLHDEKATSQEGAILRMGFDTEGLYIDNLGVYYSYTISGVEAVSGVPAASRASLQKIYPNPFNPNTTIEFSIARPGPVSVRIYDVQGRSVAKLVHDTMAPGVYRVRWDGKSDNGRELSSGIYFALLETPKSRDSARLMMIK